MQNKLVRLKSITVESLGTELPVIGNHRDLESQTSKREAIFVIFLKKLPI